MHKFRLNSTHDLPFTYCIPWTKKPKVAQTHFHHWSCSSRFSLPSTIISISINGSILWILIVLINIQNDKAVKYIIIRVYCPEDETNILFFTFFVYLFYDSRIMAKYLNFFQCITRARMNDKHFTVCHKLYDIQEIISYNNLARKSLITFFFAIDCLKNYEWFY